MSLVERAAELARRAHASQRRKGAGAPYFVHLESVAARLRAAGHDDDVTIAAAYLHDLVEDQPTFADELRREFPAEVVSVVDVLTEPKLGTDGKKLPKAQRFATYLGQLSSASEAARRARAVSCADKVDNLTSLVEDERAGRQLLVTLSTRPGQHAEQAAALRPLYVGAVSSSLLAAFDASVAALAAYVTGWLPGRAVAIAATAHLGQFDSAGAPYVFHPLRVMARAATAAERMVAVLHDVVEDTAWTLQALREEGFPSEVVAAVDRLTRREGEAYDDYIERVAGDALAARVKVHDLDDNLDRARFVAPTDEDEARFARYERARRRLLDVLGAAA